MDRMIGWIFVVDLKHRECVMKQVDWEESQGQRKQTTHDDTGNNDSPPQTVHAHGVKDAGHLLMLENYQEFNAALIIAAGGEEKVPSNVPRPVEFVCDEVVARRHHGSVRSITGKRDVIGEEGAVEFFCGPRWNRKSQQQEEEEREEVDSLEEKTVEEQLACAGRVIGSSNRICVWFMQARYYLFPCLLLVRHLLI